MVFKVSGFENVRPAFEDDCGVWIDFEDFFSLLKANYLKTDSIKLKKQNILSAFKRTDQNIKEINNKIYVNSVSVLNYIFSYSDRINFCHKISFEINNKLIDKGVQHNNNTSLYDLYVEISCKLQLLTNFSVISDELDRTDSITTLQGHYKDKFNATEWKIICYFEYHYCQNFDGGLPDYESDLSKKWQYYEELKRVINISQNIRKESVACMESRQKRKIAASSEDEVFVNAEQRHNPHLIDNSIYEKIGDIANMVACVDCNSTCTHPPSIHIYVELKTINDVDYCGAISTIQSCLSEHKLSCYNIIFFMPETVSAYVDKWDNVSRFELRDQVNLKKLENKKCYEYIELLNFKVPKKPESKDCTKCFNEISSDSLHWRTFNLATEWSLHTPLSIQIILTSFIHQKCLNRSIDKESYLRSKLLKLYSLYDSLINIHNRKYSGVLQDQHTHQLSMNFDSAQTVFSVTSEMGATSSLKTADRQLIRHSTSDKCYYNTYLKQYPLEYESIHGLGTYPVTLRQSLGILKLDNLVRLKYHNDPNPGDSRSMQICTLPITVSGVPVDSLVVSSWHNANICNGLDVCRCMNNIYLTKDDAETKLLNLLPEEHEIYNRFERMITWGFVQIWKSITKDDWFENPSTAIDDHELTKEMEESFLNLTINSESEIYDENVEQNSFIHTYVADDDFKDLSDEDEFDELMASNAVDKDEECNLTDEDIVVDQRVSSPSDSELDSDYEYTGKTCVSEQYAFKQYKPPPSITRHPPPSTGRDDDIVKLKEILDDILIKTDRCGNWNKKLKILFGPDNKIGKNLMKLIASDPRYGLFLPEFPILHLRKSKITTLCGAYKNAGLIEILKYMRDEEYQDWQILLSAEHIEKASRYIKRLSLALHTAVLVKFVATLPTDQKTKFSEDMMENKAEGNFALEYEIFLKKGSEQNATFQLHMELMQHCDEIFALSLSERLGGLDGYQLMLASVKSSLRFAFLNGASSYASYCTQLLHHHYQAGPFYKQFKAAFYSTPHKDSDVNFGLDTQREMEHKDVLKSFRSGGTLSSILPRMSLVDSLNPIHSVNKDMTDIKTNDAILGLTLTQTDLNYVSRITSLVLRRGGLSVHEDDVVRNVYSVHEKSISSSILDRNTQDIGKYLIVKHISFLSLFGHSKDTLPDIDTVNGPKELLSRVKKSKGVTIKRVTGAQQQKPLKEDQRDELKRLRLVRQEINRVQCLSSKMNTCQAIVKPDCSKPKVQKSSGVKAALKAAFVSCVGILENDSFDSLVQYDTQMVPESLSHLVKCITVEFAGVKFKTPPNLTGHQYIKFIEKAVFQKILFDFPFVKKIAVCEEKYNFTPDDFKAATRTQRDSGKKYQISHLKTAEEILTNIDKSSVTGSLEGKKLISKYLAAHITDLNLQKNVTVDIDSEHHMSQCKSYTTPIRCSFSDKHGLVSVDKLTDIKQRKGEAEMAQIDWLIEYSKSVNDGDACVSVVTSGDIDAVVLHLFTISILWKRNEHNMHFVNPVYVLLQKPNNFFDIFNITGMLEKLEDATQDYEIGIKLAAALSLGGNDYTPKFYGISHSRIVNVIFQDELFKHNFLNIKRSQGKTKVTINTEIYKDIIKTLYCPKYLNATEFSFDEIRQLSVSIPKRNGTQTQRNPKAWMPPQSAIDQLSKNINCLLQYYSTAGYHTSYNPNFIEEGCLIKTQSGDIEYDLGPNTKFKELNEIIPIPPGELLDKIKRQRKKPSQTTTTSPTTSDTTSKRKPNETPQKGRRRKTRPKTSTPRKNQGTRQELLF